MPIPSKRYNGTIRRYHKHIYRANKQINILEAQLDCDKLSQIDKSNIRKRIVVLVNRRNDLSSRLSTLTRFSHEIGGRCEPNHRSEPEPGPEPAS